MPSTRDRAGFLHRRHAGTADAALIEPDEGMPDRWGTGVEFLTLRCHPSRGSFVSAEAQRCPP
jgi:hypothetical protein